MDKVWVPAWNFIMGENQWCTGFLRASFKISLICKDVFVLSRLTLPHYMLTIVTPRRRKVTKCGVGKKVTQLAAVRY